MILIAAAVIDFGCVAQGFVYSLDTIVTNNDSRTQRVKVRCEKVGGSDSNRVTATTTSQPFAPGMSTLVKVELRAETAVNTSEYEIVMFTENSKEVFRSKVTSTVIPMDVYKSFDKSLRLQKRSAMNPGVKVKEALNTGLASTGTVTANSGDRTFLSSSGSGSRSGSGSGMSNTTTGQSILTELLQDPDDVDDLLDLPMAENMYWDATTGRMKVDAAACEVVVDGSLSLEECIARTEKLRAKRHQELELLGFYSRPTIERIRLQMFSSTATMAGDGDPLSALGEDLDADSDDRW